MPKEKESEDGLGRTCPSGEGSWAIPSWLDWYDRTLREPIHKGVIQPSDNLPSVDVVSRVKPPFPNLSTAAGCRASTAARVGATLAGSNQQGDFLGVE